MKIRPGATEWFDADGWTDMTKLIVFFFSQYCERSLKMWKGQNWSCSRHKGI